MTLRIGSLFSGAGGLDLGVTEVIDAETVWVCELDKNASKVLAERFPGVPNLGDITAVDFYAMAKDGLGDIDILTGGFPCQDVSTAGLRAGLGEGTRTGLWTYYADAIDALQPKLVVIENVRGLLSAEATRDLGSEAQTVGDGPETALLRAAGAVLGDLAELGYDAVWRTISASAFGAPHRRDRVFILAWPRDNAFEVPLRKVQIDSVDDRAVKPLPTPLATEAQQHNSTDGYKQLSLLVHDLLPTPRSGPDQSSQCVHGEGGPDLPAAIGELFPTPNHTDGTRGGAGSSPEDRRAAGHMINLADAVNGIVPKLFPTPMTMDAGNGKDPAKVTRYAKKGQPFVQLNDLATVYGEPRWQQYEPAIRRWEQIVGPAPYPVVYTAKSERPQLNPEFDEWMMGWPIGWTDVPGLTGDGRRARLKICGNGVVPQQAAGALRILLVDMVMR